MTDSFSDTNINRYFIYLAYNGKNYCGWQIQPNGLSVQEVLEKNLSILLRKEITIVGAGRTDSGVHARLMVAHFDSTEQPENLNGITEKLNRILPKDIVVYKTVPVGKDAHARFDALSRTYQYFITTDKNPFRHELLYRIRCLPDMNLMNEACKVLFEYTDFTCFSKLHTDVKTNNCKIMTAEWQQHKNNTWVFTIQADRFLRNMVRAIVGTLIEVGKGKLSVEGFREVIESKNRGNAGASVPGNALFLTDIQYPSSLFEPLTT